MLSERADFCSRIRRWCERGYWPDLAFLIFKLIVNLVYVWKSLWYSPRCPSGEGCPEMPIEINTSMPVHFCREICVMALGRMFHLHSQNAKLMLGNVRKLFSSGPKQQWHIFFHPMLLDHWNPGNGEIFADVDPSVLLDTNHLCCVN